MKRGGSGGGGEGRLMVSIREETPRGRGNDGTTIIDKLFRDCRQIN